MEGKLHRGFTLIELIATLAIAAIVLGVGVPSFVETVGDSRTRAEYNRIVGALVQTRSEAVRRSTPVTLCARASASACGTDWDEGWLIFVDAAPLASGAIATIGAEDTLIGVTGPVASDGNAISVIGSVTGASSDASARTYLTYRSRGSTTLSSASVLVCDARGATDSRVANIALTGDVRPGRPSSSSDVPRDVFGHLVDCPDPS